MPYHNKDNQGRMLPIVEEFYSVQGEGCNTGKAAYFIRIGGCDIGCSWCDTKYSWNADLHPLVDINDIYANIEKCSADAVVVTGGEPLMWNLEPLCRLLHEKRVTTYLETSGVYPLTGEWDWITLSPKKDTLPMDEIWCKADEIKVIVESENDFIIAEEYAGKVRPDCKLLLQPEWSRYASVISSVVDYVKRNTKWIISLQAHKFMHIP